MPLGRIKQDEREFWEIFMRGMRADLLKFLRQGHINILGPKKGVAIPVHELIGPR